MTKSQGLTYVTAVVADAVTEVYKKRMVAVLNVFQKFV